MRRVRLNARNGGFQTMLAFVVHRQESPQRSRRARKRNTDGGIAVLSERPIEPSANIGELRLVRRAPSRIRQPQPVVGCALEQRSEIFRVPSLTDLRFASLCELLQAIGAGGFEQPVARA